MHFKCQTRMGGSGWGILHHWTLGKLNSMGKRCKSLSNSMGGWCLRKLNFMGGWVKKVPSFPPPPQVFFSGIALNMDIPSSVHVLSILPDEHILVHVGERSGSVLECLTRDRGATGLSLTGVTVLCP